jgi:hypothetical protein
MQSPRLTSRIGAILSLLGGILVIYGVFSLPMSFGNGVSRTDVPNFELDFYFHSNWVPLAVAFGVVLTLPLLCVLFVLGTSAVSFFRELSPRMVTWRRMATIGGLLIQGLGGFVAATLWTFSLPPLLGAGFWLALLGFVVMMVGTLLN